MDIGARCSECGGSGGSGRAAYAYPGQRTYAACPYCNGSGRNDGQPPMMRPEYLELPPGVSPEAFAAECAAREYADNHTTGEIPMALFDDEPWIITEEGEDELGDSFWVATMDGCPLVGTGQTKQSAISDLRAQTSAASIAAREARDDYGDWRRDNHRFAAE